jgi:hypothetical protein
MDLHMAVNKEFQHILPRYPGLSVKFTTGDKALGKIFGFSKFRGSCDPLCGSNQKSLRWQLHHVPHTYDDVHLTEGI